MVADVDLKAGFSDPVTSAQAVFREVLDAMARPGRLGRIEAELDPPAPLNLATAAICLALIDVDTPVWVEPSLRSPEAEAFLKFHCGCRITTDPSLATFAITAGTDLPRLDCFHQGDPSYPETSTTVIVQVADLAHAQDGTREALRLTGPGIETEHRLAVAGLRDLVGEWRDNGALFPCGVDLVLTADERVAALPRTVALS